MGYRHLLVRGPWRGLGLRVGAQDSEPMVTFGVNAYILMDCLHSDMGYNLYLVRGPRCELGLRVGALDS
jgi:hypothetical protein